MFKDIYKAANDNIKADNALLEKILRQKKRKKPQFLKYSSIAAACAAVAVSLAAVPKFLNTYISEPLNETAVVTPVPAGNRIETVTDTADKTEQDKAGEIAENADDAEKPEKENGEPSLSGAERIRQSASTAKKQPSVPTEQKQPSVPMEQKQPSASTEQGGAPSEQDYRNAVIENASASEEETAQDGGTENSQIQDAAAKSVILTENAAENSVMQKTGEQRKLNAYVKTVVLCVNSEDYGGYYDAADEAAVYGGALAEGGYESAEWTMDDYYEYLGENIRSKLSLPSDFVYIGDDSISVSLDSNSVPSLDSVIFPYEGSGGRSVTVMTSKDTLSVNAYLEDERYKKSDINGSAAVVIGGAGGYKSYMAENGISYIVTARGVSEEELTDILVSIGGKI